MHRIITALLVITTATALGCRNQEEDEFPITSEREPYEELTTAADTAEQDFSSTQAVGMVTVQGGDQVAGPLTATGNLEGPVEGAPPGAVTLTEENGGTRLLLSLYGYEAGSQLQAAIVRGACGQEGQLVEAVEPIIDVPAEGVESYETTIPFELRALFNGAHSIRLAPPSEIGGAATVGPTRACADLPELA